MEGMKGIVVAERINDPHESCAACFRNSVVENDHIIIWVLFWGILKQNKCVWIILKGQSSI